ncbi:hypothetical protein ALON55S_07380 [Alishewanella longhuensis]
MISARLSLLSLAILGTTSAVSYAAQTTPELGIRDKNPQSGGLNQCDRYDRTGQDGAKRHHFDP